jgi:tetratricopeptide (TPR) repeat protein
VQPSNSDWAAAFALFDQALDLDAPERERWLGSLQGRDLRVPVLLRELLAHHDQIEQGGLHAQLLTRSGSSDAAPDTLWPGSHVGPYTLIERLGTGGMGTVWLAERADKLLDRAPGRTTTSWPHGRDQHRTCCCDSRASAAQSVGHRKAERRSRCNRAGSTLGNLYAELSMFKEAVAIQEERIASMRARGLQEQPEFGMALVDLGSALQNTDRADDALRVLREAEDVARQHPDDARLMGYVSSYLANELVYSNSADALRYARQAVRLLKKAEPRGDEMLGALMMIADTERTVDPAAAEGAGIQALDLIRDTRGSSHQLYAQTALMLGEIQSARMETSAEETFKAAQSIALASTEPGHFLRLQVDLRYGLMEVDQGRLEEGFQRLNRALDEATQAGGRDDVMYVSWAHENLARAHWRAGNLEAARREATEALRIYAAHPRDERYAKTADVAFDVALELGELQQAAGYLNESRALRQKSGGIHEPGFREQVLFREAQLDLAQGNTQKSLQQFTVVANASVPGLLRFLEVKLRARVGLSRAARLLGDNVRAAKEAQAALDEFAAEGSRPQLRQVYAQAWMELARAERARGSCDSANTALRNATNLLDVTDGPGSFRRRWLDDAKNSCN